MRKTLTVLLLAFLVTSCMDRYDNQYLTINNRSSSKFYYIISNSDTMFSIQQYYLKQRLDRGEKIGEINLTHLRISKLVPPDSRVLEKGPRDWEWYIESCTDNRVKIFFIENDSVEKYGWENIQKANIYNQKHSYSFTDLNKMNWVINYE
jgi:hypothetical protein